MAANRSTPSSVTHKMLEKQAFELAQLSANISIALNEIEEIKRYLHSDRNTNQKGIVELARDNGDRIEKLEQREKIYIAKAGVLYSFGLALGTAIVWSINKYLNFK